MKRKTKKTSCRTDLRNRKSKKVKQELDMDAIRAHIKEMLESNRDNMENAMEEAYQQIYNAVFPDKK